jgi:hypothetical protein
MALEDKVEKEGVVKDVADKEGGHGRNPTSTTSVEVHLSTASTFSAEEEPMAEAYFSL